jgi:hypothetical protein
VSLKAHRLPLPIFEQARLELQVSATHKFISKIHTLTVADVNGATLTARQVSMYGAELDRFTITK